MARRGTGYLRDYYARPAYQPRLPFHRGHKRFFSTLFPRHGNYCGPNYSSGRDHGDDLPWTAPPVSWVDYGCYIHDQGYDALDNKALLRADERLLEYLLSRPYDRAGRRAGAGEAGPAGGVRQLRAGVDVGFALAAPARPLALSLRPALPSVAPVDAAAELYRLFAVAGLATVMIPYRRARAALDDLRANTRQAGPTRAPAPAFRCAFLAAPAGPALGSRGRRHAPAP